MNIMKHNIIRNIRHIQIKKVAYCPNLFKAIITYEGTDNSYDESDDLEYIKYIEDQKLLCPPCEALKNKRRCIDE